MPYKASQFESAYRIAPVVIVLLNERNEPQDVTLNIKYRPLTLAKIQEWDAARTKTAEQAVVAEADDQPGPVAEVDEPPVDKDILARQLSEVVLDLDLVEDDGRTPKVVTFEYLRTLDLGFLKDVARVIHDRAFPEKKEFMDLMTRSKASSSGT